MTVSSIASGATSGGLTVSGGETLEIAGSAPGLKVGSGGVAYVESGGWVSGAVVESAGADYVLADGVASATTVESGGAEYVSGGVAVSATLASGGFQYVVSGGVASGTVVDLDAFQFVQAGGVASGTTVDSGGIAYVSGGSAVGAVLNAGGYEYVVSGGTATGTEVNARASAFVSAAGVASATTVESGGVVDVGVSGTASGTTVGSGGLLQVLAGGVATGGTVQSGGLAVVSSGGVVSSGAIGAGGVELVLSGGSAVGATVSSGGVLVVLSGGHATSATVATGGAVSSVSIVLQAPGVVSAWAASAGGVSVGSGATLYVATGGVASAAVLSGGVDIVQGGSAVATSVGAGGSETVRAGGVVSSSTVGAGGVEFVSSGGVAVVTGVAGGGQVLVSSGGNASGLVVGAGGSAVVSAGGSAGGATIDASGLLVFSSGAAAYGGFAFSGADAVLDIGGTLLPSGTITGFASGDTIDLTDIASASATLSLVTDLLSISAGGIAYGLQLAGALVGSLSVTGDGASGSVIVDIPCFAAGTLIRTPEGEVPVETLVPGDRVLTWAGASRPVRWIGHRLVVCARHPQPQNVRPIRIAAGAFAAGQPRRDLLLSPDHAVFTEGVLIPVRYLVNGRTVAQVAIDSINYLHVELDHHDVIVAEGLPTESFLDTGNRAAFANGGGATALHPDFARRVWQGEGCAELVLGGRTLAAAKQRLLARATALGHRITDQPGIEVFADGRPLATMAEGTEWRVRLPVPATRITLRSRTWIAAEVIPESGDTRSLGVAIARITMDGRELPMDSPALSAGWHAQEPGWRWTDGAADIEFAGASELRFTVAMTGSYWRPSDLPASLASVT